jgi:hypothetical protein
MISLRSTSRLGGTSATPEVNHTGRTELHTRHITHDTSTTIDEPTTDHDTTHHETSRQ